MMGHRVPGRHPERPERLQAVLRHLERTGYLAPGEDQAGREATDAELGRFIRGITSGALRRSKRLEEGCSTRIHGCLQGSNLAARLAAGAGIEGVSYVLEEPGRRALCLGRPPGHHALPDSGMGFCIYANIAVAAAEALAGTK